MYSRPFRGALAAILFATIAFAMAAAPQPAKKRARSPQWDRKDLADVSRVFLPDAREKLIGERPTNSGAQATNAEPMAPASNTASTESFAWSKLISPETLEDEIKSLQAEVSKTIDRPEPFKGGGYKECRRLFSEMAVLFGIIAEYDGTVRWKREAPAARDLLARAGFNCKVGTDASFKEAKARKEDLEGLVRGQSTIDGAGEPQVKWDKIAGRPPLMQRIEQAQQQGVAVWTASAGDFTKNADKLLREAQLLAAFSEVIARDGYEFADDPTYVEYAQLLKQASLDVVAAVGVKNYDQARQASGQMSKACVNCHEGYRSN
jgi:hypothetical protein